MYATTDSRRFVQLRRPRSRGFTIIESLIMAVLLAVAVSGSAVMLISINRSNSASTTLTNADEDIDSDLAAIRRTSDLLTCCAGFCQIGPPSTFGTATSSCATNDPTDDRYFFPQRDDTTTTGNITGTSTPNEATAADTWCSSAAFMTPLQTAVNAIASSGVDTASSPNAAANVRRSTTIPDVNMPLLRVTYTYKPNNRTIRVVNVMPPMAQFCS